MTVGWERGKRRMSKSKTSMMKEHILNWLGKDNQKYANI